MLVVLNLVFISQVFQRSYTGSHGGQITLPLPAFLLLIWINYEFVCRHATRFVFLWGRWIGSLDGYFGSAVFFALLKTDVVFDEELEELCLVVLWKVAELHCFWLFTQHTYYNCFNGHVKPKISTHHLKAFFIRSNIFSPSYPGSPSPPPLAGYYSFANSWKIFLCFSVKRVGIFTLTVTIWLPLPFIPWIPLFREWLPLLW